MLIDRDLWSEPSLDDPCTALCAIDRAPKRALQMESYPKFHNEVGVPIVRTPERREKTRPTVCRRGSADNEKLLVA